jgi:glutaminase
VSSLACEGNIVDESGKTVSIVGKDGTVYVEGDSEYTVTVDSYSDSADVTGATVVDEWQKYETEKPEELM